MLENVCARTCIWWTSFATEYLVPMYGGIIWPIWKRKKVRKSVGSIFATNSSLAGRRTVKPLNLLMGGGKMVFTYVFYKHIMFRRSCGVCPFTNTHRPSDLTLADFWGWEKVDPKVNADDKGISLVLVNTEKGRRLFEAVKKDMDVMPVALADCLQPNLQHPSVIHPRREAFECDYARKGFFPTMKKYGFIGWRYNLRRNRERAERKLKQVIKRIIGRR